MSSSAKNLVGPIATIILWPAIVMTLVSPSLAQFRELASEQAQSLNRNLKLTKERFSAPVLNEVASADEDVTSELEQLPEDIPLVADASASVDLAEGEALEPVAEAEPTAEPEAAQPQSVTSAATEEPGADTKAFDSFSNSMKAAPTPGMLRDIRAARFNGVEPGVTTVEELRDLWGEPAHMVSRENVDVLVYKVPTFKQVDVHVPENAIVSGVLVHLLEPIPVAQAARELELLDFTPAPIPDEYGKLLGQAYPERGVIFSYADGMGGVSVSRVMLEPISGEMFRLRAEYDFDHQYQRDMSDLKEALDREPHDAHAHWLRSQIMATTGRYATALDSAMEAVRWAPEVHGYQLTKARLLALTGEYERGVNETKDVVSDPQAPAEIAARAEAQLGDLLVMGPKPDYQEALKHHLRAIDLAAKVIDERRFAVRRVAKKVLVDAHLAIAMDVALGNFQRQDEVVPKWLMRGTEIAEQFITQDNGDPAMRMEVYRTSLAAFGVLKGKFDASVAVDEAISEGRKLIAAAADPVYQQRIERGLAETLFHAVKLERAKGRQEEGIRYANNALALLRNIATDHASNEYDQYLQGQLNYLIGSLHAVHDEDHAEAINWYAKALPKMVQPSVNLPWLETNDLGEVFVSMGVSFWANGDKEKAVRLTQRGADLMQNSIRLGVLDSTAMAIPYANLATMHGKLGHTAQSRDFAAMASRLEDVLKKQQGTLKR